MICFVNDFCSALMESVWKKQDDYLRFLICTGTKPVFSAINETQSTSFQRQCTERKYNSAQGHHDRSDVNNSMTICFAKDTAAQTIFIYNPCTLRKLTNSSNRSVYPKLSWEILILAIPES
ncbi:hypothetical protein NECAME_09192 [Necator americanus]|uniref:Uncharacterized protein n=1 Tax=Necator americanus TaxID=51031 RepID=W2THC5_NECAM|nr:hypothetical protein NECAME_09192 [Necator americanus]ETN80402.1 hypothetical protein NECAME_09192 [Necator americanus]